MRLYSVPHLQSSLAAFLVPLLRQLNVIIIVFSWLMQIWTMREETKSAQASYYHAPKVRFRSRILTKTYLIYISKSTPFQY